MALYMGNWGYNRYKRSYGTLLITGRGPLCGNEFLFWAGFYQKFASQDFFWTDFEKNTSKHILESWVCYYVCLKTVSHFFWKNCCGFNPLENTSQIGSFPQAGLKIKNAWNRHLVNLKQRWWILLGNSFGVPSGEIEIQDSGHFSL